MKTKPLGELCDVRDGTHASPQYVENGFYLLTSKNFSSGKVSYEGARKISKHDYDEINKRSKVDMGDIVMPMIGTIGSPVFITEEPDYAIKNVALIKRNTQPVCMNYIHAFLSSPLFEKAVKVSKRGGTQKFVSLGDLRNLQVPLPPLDEQKRIAAILDQADALRRLRQGSIDRLNQLGQAIFYEMFGDPVTNPMGWATKSLIQSCHCSSGGTPSKSNDEFWKGSLPWFSPKDLKANDLFDSQDHINENVLQKTTINLLPANTVVIVVRGMILAHTFPVSTIKIPATINQDIKALLPREPLEPQFLAACLRAEANFALQQVSESAHGTKRLDSDGLGKIPILIPPLPLQQEFTRRVEVIEKQKSSFYSSLAELDKLFSSLQHLAFQGEL
ncbi:MAG: restriction endonuclease subunit S [Cyanobacteriota bacterium]|nr:restriction endonuclease subunit S [Cyanobacteriota bacterium]